MPHLPPSEIFANYAQIAKEKGLIKSAQESKALKDYKNSNYPRVGSDDLSTIEALYGLKPETSQGMEYERNLAEVAHPHQVILAPAYDKLNGLVENVNERQKILINITQKPVNGHLTHKKYASELMDELVRTATDLDNQNMDQLRALADTCIVQLNKQALSPWYYSALKGGLGLGGWVGVAAGLLGAAYLYNHMGAPDKGIVANTQQALDAINALIGEDWFHSTFYATLRPEFISDLKKLRTDLQSLLAEANSYMDTVAQNSKLGTLQDLMNTAQTSGQEVVHKYEEFRHFLQNILPEINDAITKYSDANVRDLAIKNETWLSELTSKIEPIFHGGWGLFTDRFDDIKSALVTLKNSMDETVAQIDTNEQQASGRAQHIATALQESKEYAAPSGGSADQPAASPAQPTMEEMNKQIGDLVGGG